MSCSAWTYFEPTASRHAILRFGVMLTAVLLVVQMGSMLRLQIEGASISARIAVAATDRAALAIVTREIEGGRGGHGVVPLAVASPEMLMVQSSPDHRIAQLPCAVRGDRNGARRIAYRLRGGALERRVQCRVGGEWRLEVAYSAVVSGLGAGAGRFRYFDVQGGELHASATNLDLGQRASVGRVRLEWADPDGSTRTIVDALVRGSGAFRHHIDAITAPPGAP